MTPAEFYAICARDDASSMQDLRLFQSVKDRRELRKYVEELREELSAFKAAAGKVTCATCIGKGTTFTWVDYQDIPCPDCAELRKLLE